MLIKKVESWPTIKLPITGYLRVLVKSMINVIIERVVDPTMLDIFRQTLLQTRRLALESQGYLSGESYMDVERQNHWYVISSWETLEDWKRWQASDERHEMLLAYKAMLVEPERITVTECTR